MLVSSFFPSKIITKPKKIYLSCRASKWQFPLALTELLLVNASGRVQFSSPDVAYQITENHEMQQHGRNMVEMVQISLFFIELTTRVCIKPRFYHKAQPGGFYGFYEGGFLGFYGLYVDFINLKVYH